MVTDRKLSNNLDGRSLVQERVNHISAGWSREMVTWSNSSLIFLFFTSREQVGMCIPIPRHSFLND